MTPAGYVGDLRRSSAASTFGPGAIADLRTQEGAPISVVMAVAEEWSSLTEHDLLHDPRLEKLLGVNGFRLAPVSSNEVAQAALAVPAVRFPAWLQCPRCHVLRPAKDWAPHRDGSAARKCASCSQDDRGNGSVFVVPVRFVMACDAGHLDDFDWAHWVRHDTGCHEPRSTKLIAEGSGLSGLYVQCGRCEKRRSLEEAFRNVLTDGWSCRGRRPWTGLPAEDCDRPARLVQRGASNLYFPITRSSLLIPPFDNELEDRVSSYWPLVTMADPREPFVRNLVDQGMVGVPTDVSVEEFIRAVCEYADLRQGASSDDLRQAEWGKIRTELGRGTRDFEVRVERVPAGLHGLVDMVVRIPRLRELRALTGFTRIVPPPAEGDGPPARRCDVLRSRQKWLPAVEVRGEGIFLSLAPTALERWESREDVQERVQTIDSAWRREYQQRFETSDAPPRRVTARQLLIHAFAHAVMRQLSLECGYSTASLRERLYSGDFGAGVLIYTATSDADGTLGGLERQGRSERIANTVRDAIRAVRWCSSDPLCIEGRMVTPGACSIACCHACLHAPETSCEDYNRFLDRALLVGSPDVPDLGFFRALVEEDR
ncbi:MAG: DUF1998 domain-containing protein [Gemmatimonadaceae bacterium]|nr:DUF1998 domain-containing protein [Gemmatimonadaceae bacterium]